jgi:D-alanine transaminase
MGYAPNNAIRTVYLNGEYLAPRDATVSVFDRGFLFADGVYEVIPAYGGRLFRFRHHLDRLNASLTGIRLANPLSAAEWESMLNRLLADHGAVDQYLYLQVTRGPAPRDHAFPRDVRQTVMAYSQPLTTPDAATLARGVSAITVNDIRWSRCDIKSIALLGNILMRQQATEAGAAEAILLRDGCMTEGSASNIFIVRDGRLITPPKGPQLLPGITRDLVLEIARAHDLPCEERVVTEAELRVADEIWLTSSTREVLAITTLDGQPVGAGRPGALHARLHALFQEAKRAFREGHAE